MSTPVSIILLILLGVFVISYCFDRIQRIWYAYKGKRITSYRKYVRRETKWLEDCFVRIGLLFIAWLVISWVNVNMHNLEEGYVYPSWNFFRIFLRN